MGTGGTDSTSEAESTETESESTDTDSTETDSTETDTDTDTDTETTGEPACGDGALDDDEECDDANEASFDGCSSTCTIEHPIERLSVGESHMCVQTPLGLKCWGVNASGSLGLGDSEHRGDGPREMGLQLPWVDVGFPTVFVRAGNYMSCSVGPLGELGCWGYESHGQVGLGDVGFFGDEPGEMGDALPHVDLAGPVEWVAQGGLNTCAKLEQGLKCWGENGSGSLGLGDTNDRGLDLDDMGNALPFVDLEMDPVEVVLGGNHACARDDLGRVKCWGAGVFIGLGSSENQGDEPGEMGAALPFVDLGLDAVAVDLSQYRGLTCAVLESGVAKCWGNTQVPWAGVWLWPDAEPRTGDEPGEMGDALPELTSGDDRAVVEVAAGEGFYCVRLDDGAVRCVGRNQYGQLGQGHTDPINDWLEDVADIELGEPAVEIGAGGDHVCARMQSGNVKCWGCLTVERGECDLGVGYGDIEARGDEPGEMGDALPYVSLF